MGERSVLFLIAALIAGVAIRQPPLVILASLLLVGAGFSALWARYVLARLTYEREFPQRRAHWGEEVDYYVRLTNRKLLPVPWLEIDEDISLKLDVLNHPIEPSHVVGVATLARNTSLRWYERTTYHYRLRCRARGYHRIGPVTLRSGDLFGLFRRVRILDSFDRLLVYPRIYPLAGLRLPPRQPLGELRGADRIFEDPIRTAGVRDYRPSDPLKRIDWKATARRMALQVRVYEPTTTYQLVIFLNVSTLPFSWQGHDPERLEAVISAAASMAAYANAQGYSVGLYANGTVPESRRGIRIAPGRDPMHLTQILEALAMVTSFTYNSIESVLLREGRHLPWGATVVLITAIFTESMLESLSRLRGFGVRLIVLTLDPVEPRLQVPGLRVHTLAEVAPEAAAPAVPVAAST